jgi:hypothetical protein
MCPLGSDRYLEEAAASGGSTRLGTASLTAGDAGDVTLAFAGDIHFQLHLAALLERPQRALGPIARVLADADLTMVNLESAITHRGTPEPKEREVPDSRYYFRTRPAALDVLAAAGVDVVTMANNHGADYGPVGVADTLAGIRTSPVAVVGIGRNRRAAFTPYRVTIRGTDFALIGANGSMREGASSVWAAGPTNPGLAAAHADRPRALLGAVRAASRQDDIVIIYLHWGAELQGCPTHWQRTTARALAEAGADIIVGSHDEVVGYVGGVAHAPSSSTAERHRPARHAHHGPKEPQTRQLGRRRPRNRPPHRRPARPHQRPRHPQVQGHRPARRRRRRVGSAEEQFRAEGPSAVGHHPASERHDPSQFREQGGVAQTRARCSALHMSHVEGA